MSDAAQASPLPMRASPSGGAAKSNEKIELSVSRTLLWRVILLLFALYAFFALDRGNIGLAALRMNTDLHFTSATYGLGASLFTLAYLIFQIPAAVIMKKVGPARGLACVAIAWGLASAGTAFVWNSASFLAIRFVLGMAEAGFGAFIVYYINAIIPRRTRGFALAMTLFAVPVTMVISSPISGALLGWSAGGLSGWQWLFAAEGIPSVLLGLLCLAMLPNSVDDMAYLDAEQKAWLRQDLASSPAKASHSAEIGSIWQAARTPAVWVLGLTLFAGVLGTNTFLFWMPQMIAQISKANSLTVGFLNSVPWIAFGASMLALGRIADRVDNKVPVLATAMVTAAIGCIIGGLAASATLAFVGIMIAAFGVGAVMGLFWTVPMQMLRGSALAGTFAAINMVGNSSGIVSHPLIGWLRDLTGGFGPALALMAVVLLIAPLVLILFQKRQISASA